MKETAVEFLVDEFKEKLIGHNLPEWVEKIIEQAKDMEKEQLFNAFDSGPYFSKWENAEQYYNKTFKSE